MQLCGTTEFGGILATKLKGFEKNTEFEVGIEEYLL